MVTDRGIQEINIPASLCLPAVSCWGLSFGQPNQQPEGKGAAGTVLTGQPPGAQSRVEGEWVWRGEWRDPTKLFSLLGWTM